jgi:hypothetical protein
MISHLLGLSMFRMPHLGLFRSMLFSQHGFHDLILDSFLFTVPLLELVGSLDLVQIVLPCFIFGSLLGRVPVRSLAG